LPAAPEVNPLLTGSVAYIFWRQTACPLLGPTFM